MAINPGSESYTSPCAIVMFLLLLHELTTWKLKCPCLLLLPPHHHLSCRLTPSQGFHTDPGQAQAAPVLTPSFFLTAQIQRGYFISGSHSGRVTEERCREAIEMQVVALLSLSVPAYFTGKGRYRSVACFSVPLPPCVKQE